MMSNSKGSSTTTPIASSNIGFQVMILLGVLVIAKSEVYIVTIEEEPMLPLLILRMLFVLILLPKHSIYHVSFGEPMAKDEKNPKPEHPFLTINTTVETLRRMVFGSRFFREGTKDGSPGDEETEHMSALFTILEYLYSGTFCKGNKSRARSCGKVVPRVCSLPIPYVYAEDNRSVRAEEIPCGSTDPDDDNMWRKGMENSCRVVIQGLSPNADIPGHADNDLPRPYATVVKTRSIVLNMEEPRNSNKMWNVALAVKEKVERGR
ncbi:hypothetical protein Tco_0509775 [Tanacetum coccineum]